MIPLFSCFASPIDFIRKIGTLDVDDIQRRKARLPKKLIEDKL
jgi:hypothetical protein